MARRTTRYFRTFYDFNVCVSARHTGVSILSEMETRKKICLLFASAERSLLFGAGRSGRVRFKLFDDSFFFECPSFLLLKNYCRFFCHLLFFFFV